MSLIETVADDRPEHPVDVVERLAAVNEWAFDRAEDDEISILVSGVWANYDVAFTWMPEMESLHVSCSFDLKTPPRKRAAIGELTQLINEQLWLGHFDLWSQQDLVMFRHSLCLAGGAAASDAQCGAVVKAAVNACETYYQAFQFVLWADREPREAMAFAAFETTGLGLTRRRPLSARFRRIEGTGARGAIACKSRAPIFRAARSRALPFGVPVNGRSQTQNVALAPRHAPLGRRAQGADLRRGQGFGRTAPPAPHRPQERHVSGPPGSEAEIDDRRRLSLRRPASGFVEARRPIILVRDAAQPT